MNLELKKQIERIKKQPNAFIILNALQNLYEEEQKERMYFYETVSENDKAEFINGKIIIHSPVMYRHSNVVSNLSFFINTFIVSRNLQAIVAVEKLMIRLTRNDYEPDICFFGKEKAKDFKADQLLFPAPDFVVEVLSKSTEKTDRTIKFNDYQSHGVKEYWIVDPENEFVEQYVLENEMYELKEKTSSGQINSFVISGFEIPVKAFFDKQLNNETMRNLL